MEERQKSNKGRIADLDTQIAEHNAQATTLRQHIQELELSNVSLQAEHNLLESVNTRLEEKTHDNEVLRQQLAKSKVEHVDATASLATYRDKLESLRGEKENLQVKLSGSVRSTWNAYQLCSNVLRTKNGSSGKLNRSFLTLGLKEHNLKIR